MNRLKRLVPIMELAETKEKQAAHDFGLSRQKLDEAREGLSSLRSFRENYSARFHQSGSKGLGVQQLSEYRAFLNRINGAIAEQEKVIQSRESDVQVRKAAWENTHRYVLGLQKIIDRLRADESRHVRQREQVELDERAGRRFMGSRASLMADS